MAEQKNVWLASDGTPWDTEAEADARDTEIMVSTWTTNFLDRSGLSEADRCKARELLRSWGEFVATDGKSLLNMPRWDCQPLTSGPADPGSEEPKKRGRKPAATE